VKDLFDRHSMTKKVYTGKVSLPTALAYDPENPDHKEDDPKTWSMFDAADYDEDHHGHMKFICPDCFEDEKAQVELSIIKDETERLYPNCKRDPITGKELLGENGQPAPEDRLYKFPPHFSAMPGQYHKCDMTNRKARFSEFEKNLKEAQDGDDVTYTIKMSIPTNAPTPPRNYTGRLDREFKRSARSTLQPSDDTAEPKSAAEMSKILDATERKKSLRQSIQIEKGKDKWVLDDIYFEKDSDMHKALAQGVNQTGSSDHNKEQVALFRFRPSGNMNDWKDLKIKPSVVISRVEKIMDNSEREFHVTTHLKFQTYSAFKTFEAARDAADNPKSAEFLIYSDHVQIDPSEYSRGIDYIDKRRELSQKAHADLHVTVNIYNKKQFALWKPPSPQLLLFDENFKALPNTHTEESDLEL